MDRFDWLIFVHVMGVVLIAAGAGIGMAAGITMPRTSSVRTIKTLSGLAATAEHFVTTPGAVITLITGTWFVADDSGEVYQQFDLGETWLWMSYVLWVIAVVLGEGVLGRFHHRLNEKARALADRGVETSDELRAAAGAPVGSITGSVLTLVLVLFVLLMVWQPGG
jgi:uncharacterized membrane protein